MRYEVKIKVYSDPNLLKYLKEHSYWYKELNRDPNSINRMTEEMKVAYGLRFTDKVNKFKTGVDLINAFLNVTE